MLSAISAAKRLGLKRLYLPYDEALPQLESKGLDLINISSVKGGRIDEQASASMLFPQPGGPDR